jgi:hypothetical protein
MGTKEPLADQGERRSPSKPAPKEEEQPPSRQERREERRRRDRQRMEKHGASLRRVYRDAVSKRAAPKRKKGSKA